MNRAFIDSKNFKGIDFTKKHFEIADYELCTFENCNFSEMDLSGTSFVECEFDNCNLSMCKLNKTQFNEVVFHQCKLLGLQFENCDPIFFEIEFNNSIINLSSFYQLNLKNVKMNSCSLHEVDFTESNLKAFYFNDCDLKKTIFERTMLEKADFRTAYNYSIDPENNHIQKAKFSQVGLEGLLHKYNIEVE